MSAHKIRNQLYVLGFLLASACTPQNEEVTEEQVQVAPVQEALDTIASTDKDALKTDENNISPTLPLPQPLMQQLTAAYPGWEQPTLTEGAQERGSELEQGPFIVRGDFDGDTRQDVALQLEKDKDVIVVAALNKEDGTFELFELKQDILFNERGILKSLYYLYLAEEGEEIQSQAGEELEMRYDVVLVGIEGNRTAYIFNEGAFRELILEE